MKSIRLCWLLALVSGLWGFVPNLGAQNQTPPPFRIGINFAFAYETNVGVGTVISNLAGLGVKGIRHCNPSDQNWLSVQANATADFNFTVADPVFFNTNGLIPLATLYEDPNPNGPAVGLQVPWIVGSGFSFTPTELAYASNYVKAVVTHNQAATHLWEISNEVSGKTNRPNSLSPEDFAAYLVTNRTWIKAFDPQASVVLPGCLGSLGLPVTNGPTWLRQVFTALTALGTNGFDVVNYHDYKPWWALPVQYDAYYAVMKEFNQTNLPVWVTESASAYTNAGSGPVVVYAGEDQQAADVWRRSCLLFGKGVSLWIWHSFYSSSNSNFAFQGLLSPLPEAKKKKSWHAFHLLTQTIEGFQSAHLLQSGNATTNLLTGGDGQWAVQFDWSDGTRRYVAWSNTNLNYTLTQLDTNAAPYRITRVVPATISADGETVTFAITTNNLTGTSLTLSGTNLPVLVESTLSPYQIWANTRIANATLRDTSSDPDGDGQNNYAEYLAGTNPMDNQSVFKLTQIQAESGHWRIYWNAVTNRTYSIQTSTALPAFTTSQTNVVGTNTTMSWLDTNVYSAPTYYRLVIP